ncbi:MAG: Glycine betaine/carnitine/choline transport system permease protein OpuCB [Chlamydiia bacterium]|nr:Glycine betaine/carnitine/choline transport system permease protein OpuCB [Chlamydiia bacterium]MCH9616335.1 Glycine betaine/carnitine/choline transport system permease protein OpuCB [Chlamydiia bacterium]MCH9629679.1 Glycine betaine/carnitine/choline transport system permease protein OpuCB [Chlamydiia bacterium]
MIWQKTLEHLYLTLLSIFLSALIAIPLGVFLSHLKGKRLPNYTLKFVGLLQTIPGIALIALTVVFLALLHPYLHNPTIGLLPGVIVLTVYALLPILTNTYHGMLQIDRTTLEVARAMGMNGKQRLYYVELPLALPMILSGIRTAFMMTIGMVTLTSLVGAGGLGDLILQGLRTMNTDLIIAGTLPAMGLAFVIDFALDRCQKQFTPM